MKPFFIVLVGILGCELKNVDPQDGTIADDTATAITDTSSTATGTETASADTIVTTTDGEGESLCQAFCGRLEACGLEDKFDGCPCSPAEASEKCFQEWKLTVECFEFDTCESLESNISPCWKRFAKAAVCGDETCVTTQIFGDDVPVDGCAFEQECLEAPDRRLVCDELMCVCELGGMSVQMGTCFPSGICTDVEQGSERIEECCA